MVAGFQEIPHTADWELHAYAPSLAGLFEQCALGMSQMAGVQIDPAQPAKLVLEVSAPDQESLLVNFLGEILWLGEGEGLGFDHFAVHITPGAPLQLAATLSGGCLLAVEKEIKAVTWHRLAIRPTDTGWEVNIVFDV